MRFCLPEAWRISGVITVIAGSRYGVRLSQVHASGSVTIGAHTGLLQLML